jgi:hypothetical protein
MDKLHSSNRTSGRFEEFQALFVCCRFCRQFARIFLFLVLHRSIRYCKRAAAPYASPYQSDFGKHTCEIKVGDVRAP